MNGSIMGMTKAEITRKLDEIVDFAGIERYLDTPVKRFSSGMTVRLGFAVAAFLEPEILVVDEVLAVGDAEFQKKAIGKMKDVSSSGGRTVLFVSHNMGAVRNLCNNGIVLRNGTMQFAGTVEDAISEYMVSCLNEGSDLPISEMPRVGKCSGVFKVIDIEYLDGEGNKSVLHCGRHIKIDFTVKVNSANDIKSAKLDCAFLDLMGTDFTNFSTTMKMEEFSLSSGIHHVILDIPKFPLTEGEYRMGIYLVANGECSDWLMLSNTTTVEDDAFFETPWRIAPHLRGKIVLIDHNWEIK